MAKIEIKPEPALFPLPVILVTCADKAGKPNIITLAWAGMVCSEPPMLSISIRPHRHSYALIKESGEFVVNIPSSDIVRQTDICGTVSGKDTDKFALTGLTPEKAKTVNPPLIKECPVSLECKVKQTLMLGTHEVFIGEILAVHIDEGVMMPSNSAENLRGIDYAKAKPFTFNRSEYWSPKDKIGFYGCTRK